MRGSRVAPTPQGPRSPAAELRVFQTSQGAHLFVVDGSRVYDIDPATAARIAAICAEGPDGALDGSLAASLGLLDGARRIDGAALRPPPLRSMSLNVAQSCNMGCGYCYADFGRFGGSPRRMERDVAEAAIDRLIAESEPGACVVLGFMGGEPLLNRPLVHHAAHYGAEAARRAGRSMRFSITTNATLMSAEDAALFHRFPFAVQVSIDGSREQNDAARPMNSGASSYDRVIEALRLMAEVGRPRHLAARVTVTPATGNLLPILDHLIALGFDDVGFAPVTVSPDPAHALGTGQFGSFLDRMIACGRKALAELAAGRPYPFANFATALAEIHRGSHRPYPCGAGAAYLSAGADGGLFACHRLVDDAAFAMGDVVRGSDLEARAAHLARTHVDRAEPCRACWARYLCGGGCHHEVSRRGRVGCDYIRGWLEFCLAAYVELMAARPDYFVIADDGGWPPPVAATPFASGIADDA
jgi:uncharacterized protein